MSASCSIGSNYAVVEVGKLMLFFSYRTLIGFRVEGQSPVLIKNYWGPTTGKHLNAIDASKKTRLSEGAFKIAFTKVLKSFGLMD